MSVHDAKERLAGFDSASVLARVVGLFETIGDKADVHAAEALRTALEAAADFLAGDYDESHKKQVHELVAAQRRSLMAPTERDTDPKAVLAQQLMAEILADFEVA